MYEFINPIPGLKHKLVSSMENKLVSSGGGKKCLTMAPPGAAARRPLVQELGSFMIFVKHLTGETSMLDVEASDTIASVKLQAGITEQHGLQAGPICS